MINQPIRNRGDESAHKALVRSIVKTLPDVKVTVLFFYDVDEHIRQFNVHLPNVTYVNITKTLKGWGRIAYYAFKYNLPVLLYLHPDSYCMLKYYKEADLVLCAPGGICMGGFQNWIHVLNLQVAKMFHKPLAYYGRSIGPFPTTTAGNRIFRKRSYEMIHYFSFFSLRDNKSVKLAKAIGVDCISTVDSAFLDSPCVTVPKAIIKTIGVGNKYIIFVPNTLTWHYAYKNVSNDRVLDFFCRMIDIILVKYPDRKIVMLPQTYGQGENNDVLFFRKIADMKKEPRLVVVDDIYSSDVQQTIICSADLVVGARYHSIVFAINNAVPFVSLSYEHKMSGLLETLGMEQYMVDITHALDSEQSEQVALERFNSLLDADEPVNEAQLKAKQIAWSCFDKFKIFAQMQTINK